MFKNNWLHKFSYASGFNRLHSHSHEERKLWKMYMWNKEWFEQWTFLNPWIYPDQQKKKEENEIILHRIIIILSTTK